MPTRTMTLEQLAIPAKTRTELGIFLEQLAGLYGDNLVSVVAFGSAVSGDWIPGNSDLNLFVIHADLNIIDLDKVAKLARHWAGRRGFSPRFLSRRNLEGAKQLFPIDFLPVATARAVIFGEDPFNDLAFDRTALVWQCSYQLKALRMQVKQQYWRSLGKNTALCAILARRFGTLAHIARGLLYLKTGENIAAVTVVLDRAAAVFGLDRKALAELDDLRRGKRAARSMTAPLFQKMMELVRILDDAADELRA